MNDTDPPPAPNPPDPQASESPAPEQAPSAAPAPVAPPAAAGPSSTAEIQNKKLVAGLFGILLGGLGIHKFYLGYQQEGIIMLLVTVVGGGVGSAITCGLAAPVIIVMPVIGLIEGILYLTKSDQEFMATYVTGRKPWF